MAAWLVFAFSNNANAEPQQNSDQKSGAVATTIAVGGTLAGLGIAIGIDDGTSGPRGVAAGAVAFSSLAVGPSLGHIYANESRHALRWTAYRALGVAALGGGLYLIDRYDRSGLEAAGAGLALAGSSLFVVGFYRDLWDAHRAASRYNARHMNELSLTPIASQRLVGLNLVGSF